MNHEHAPVRFPLMLICFIPLLAISACSPSTSSPSEASSADLVENPPFLGKWNLSSQAILENGHSVTADNDYEFKSDGTFTNLSRSKLLNGDTGEPFYTLTTAESGTWTVEGDTTCWTTLTAIIEESESFTDLISHEMIKEGLSGEAPPECFTVVSADQSSVVLRPNAGGDSVTLLRRE